MSLATKVCPSCSERVEATADACPYCNWDFVHANRRSVPVGAEASRPPQPYGDSADASIAAMPRFSPASLPNEPRGESLEATWERVGRIWWSIAWRNIAFGLPVLGVVLFTAASMSGNDDLDPLGVVLLILVCATVLIPVQIAVLKHVLNKRFADYHIELVSNAQPTREQEVSWGHAGRIWWSFAWRVVLSCLLASIVLYAVISLTIGISNLPDSTDKAIGNGVGFAIQIAVLRHVLNKRFPDYHLEIVRNAP